MVLEVSDPDRNRLPRPHDSTPEEVGGRGLALVAALADHWGCRQEPYAKCVWARFGLEGGSCSGDFMRQRPASSVPELP
ncbi:ATP-binding protein [Streptomyces hokutonensis]|uniref:ATP-binding protein n=1 Tax=Streptomyces hokutonensis TaxID=1306990 RepID=UPI0033F74822